MNSGALSVPASPEMREARKTCRCRVHVRMRMGYSATERMTDARFDATADRVAEQTAGGYDGMRLIQEARCARAAEAEKDKRIAELEAGAVVLRRLLWMKHGCPYSAIYALTAEDIERRLVAKSFTEPSMDGVTTRKCL